MRSVKSYVAAGLLLLAGTVVAAQSKISTPEELDKTMKAVNAANGTMRKAVASGAFADAKTAAAELKKQFTIAETFWVHHKKDDAVKMNQATIAKITAVETALEAATPDAAAVQGAVKELGGTCQACHMQYRVQNPDGQGYMIKPGTIGGGW
jgi:cytochrome c556